MQDVVAFAEVALRLVVATLAGAALGLNRELHGKPTGLRTLGLVGLGSAAAVMAVAAPGHEDNASRVVQGIVTGIGFLGAGVIVRPPRGMHIHGLTTAACAWTTACIGVLSGLGSWRVLSVALLAAADRRRPYRKGCQPPLASGA